MRSGLHGQHAHQVLETYMTGKAVSVDWEEATVSQETHPSAESQLPPSYTKQWHRDTGQAGCEHGSLGVVSSISLHL